MKDFVINSMQVYANFFENNIVWIAIFFVLLIALARTKVEMHWIDIWAAGSSFGLWVICEFLLRVVL